MNEHDKIMELIEGMIVQQRSKVLRLACHHYPDITPEDIRNPQDFPKLLQDPNFNFEDGILSGYIAAKIALSTEIKMWGTSAD